jgi:hypothetical protein
MNGNENTLLGLLTGGRFMTSGDLPTGKQVVSRFSNGYDY